ncbi:rRNA pseudouridine synthase [Paenibacillus melissococcoides]|uniref:Pseudouridine synthase n=1 Tax=Paenibacillus melissococcoides TaxID=2912268 RepID=A0ABN8U3H3_9BACL|nr:MULTISPECIES: pseudouridine synthase [Paenibacillus]MEB9895574.1 pseudouridine synthase [Bacillus cereus]CAH8245615.1 rRNA pseudouridine synthase [Paenibacillus melissococcoides]CAH8711475.1 rRNA pseudouridine synthase [Paenibacillus melissococcoides]CAH8712239.1 rRNA pseudouridine synthase [Paenibacillus melissococcoides]GIO76951.1 ribosomal large subunit pseudouridine synthase B [Paenibacillus dendritiformis]
MEERLQKIMANAGVASRRKCEQLILDGKVEVNGEVVTALGVKADPATDIITVNGKPITANANKVYAAFHKPKGVITSMSDPEGRKTVLDFVKGIGARVYPVGRLDYDTEGLLLLTNDGDLANMLMHPRHHVAKTYHATVKGIPHGDLLEKLREGIQLEDGMTQPAEVEYHDVDMERKSATISITIYEGRNRQVRRMFEAIGHPVVKLKRVQFGSIFLQGIPRGKFRHLTKSEVNELKMAIKANRTEA